MLTQGRGGKGQVMVAREAGMARESRAQKQREQREGRSDARGWAMAAPEWEAELMGSCFLEAKRVYVRLRWLTAALHWPNSTPTIPT
jgi:hypothetical protein